ncbi:hypothetical protein ACWDWV_27340, partial [Streptosporangium sandarakinum]
MHVAVAAGPGSGGVLLPAGGEARTVADLAAAVRELETGSGARAVPGAPEPGARAVPGPGAGRGA